MSRETDLGLYFPAVTYYDGQGFMVPQSRNIDSALDSTAARSASRPAPRPKLNLADFFGANNMKYEEVKLGKLDEALAAYEDGQCDCSPPTCRSSTRCG